MNDLRKAFEELLSRFSENIGPFENETPHVVSIVVSGAELRRWRDALAESAEKSNSVACEDCGAPYGADGWCDVIVPDEIWNQLNAGLLCFRCMTKRIEVRGHTDVPVIVASGPYKDDNETWRIIGWDHGYKIGREENLATLSKPIDLAILFHDTYERLAPSFGYETRADTRVFDPESKNGHLMVAVCEEILGRLVNPLCAEVAALEELRPHWAQGFSSDSIAAQASVTALAQLWKLLGVDNQTAAVARIHGVLNDR